MNTTAILFVGYPAAGKSTALQAAAEHFPTIEMSAVAGWKFEQYQNRQPKGDDLRTFGDVQRGIHGNGIFGHHLVRYIRERMNTPEYVAVSGIRSPGEINALQHEGVDTYIIHVHAPFEDRLARIQARGREGEEDFDADDLKERDLQEVTWGVNDCMERADWKIANRDGDEEDFIDLVGSELLMFLDGPAA